LRYLEARYETVQAQLKQLQEDTVEKMKLEIK
jgi:hypothetical protein